DHQAGALGSLQACGFDPPEGVAQLVGDTEDVVDHDSTAPSTALTRSPRPITAPSSSTPGSTTTPAATIEPLTLAPSPPPRPPSTTDRPTLAPASPRQPGDPPPRGPIAAAGETSAPAATSSPGAVAATRVATRPSRMSQLASR